MDFRSRGIGRKKRSHQFPYVLQLCLGRKLLGEVVSNIKRSRNPGDLDYLVCLQFLEPQGSHEYRCIEIARSFVGRALEIPGGLVPVEGRVAIGKKRRDLPVGGNVLEEERASGSC